MTRHVTITLLTASLCALASGCGKDSNSPAAPVTETFRATMNGANERPTARTTPATGTADFTLRRDTLYWVEVLSNATNVTASHIHIGGPDVAGGILLPLTPGTTGVNNTRIAGFITRTGFVAPASPNQAITFDNLLDMMRSGGVYVNVHSNNTANDPTNNTGPGDFPAGEIRGQVVKL